MLCSGLHGDAKYKIHVSFDFENWPSRSEGGVAECPLPVYGVDIFCCSDEELMDRLESVSGLGHAAEVSTVEA